jgi:CRP-like cAMP-binding protein
VTDRLENRLLRELARVDREVFAQIRAELEPFPLQPGSVLGTPRVVAAYTYFMDSGAVSLVASTQGGQSLGVAMIGREGVANIADVLGAQPLPYRLVVQLPGLAYRVPKAVIREHIFSCSALHGLLMVYSQRLMHQLAQSALCNRFHSSSQRLARWLLHTAERADTNRFEVTHEFVAQMVGAPRPVVSEAAADLRDRGMIDYRRGVLTIRNARRLQGVACECFDVVSRLFDGDGPSRLPSQRSPRR